MADLALEATRKARRSKRKGAANYCACGCGTEIPWISKKRTPQRFAWGHSIRKTRDEMYEIRDCGYATPCWLWLGGSNERGYGRMSTPEGLKSAHRVFYEENVGPISEGYEVDHLCFVPACVNPAHLEAVTPLENKRRSRALKLTAADAAAIRRAREEFIAGSSLTTNGKPRQRTTGGFRDELAARYGVRKETIRDIWNGKRWAA
jgi:hypothetical protein